MLFSSFRKEREQVLAHSELFIGTAWYRQVMPHHRCEAVGIRREDSPAYLDAIATKLTDAHPPAFTLAAIEKSSFKIAGCIYCNLPDDCAETLVVGHLKVDAQYQRRATAQIHASQRGWWCSKARLAVLAENWPARNCYAQAGSRQVSIALMPGLLKASTMKCNGFKWPVLSRASRASGAGRGRGKRGCRCIGRDPCTRGLRFYRCAGSSQNWGHVGQCFIARDMGRFRIPPSVIPKL